MRDFELDMRLKACADMVSAGARIIDVGTDHAYLPIWLVMHGIIKNAIASDINDLPLLKAGNNIKKYKVDDKIKLIKSDGLDKINPYDIDEIVISGMGGELIAQIIKKTLWVKKHKKRLILQPMSSEYDLREFLIKEKFNIEKEQAIISGKRVYTVINAIYDGEKKEYPCEYPYIGRIADNMDNASIQYIKRQIRDLNNRLKGAYSKKDMDMYNKNLYIINRLNNILDYNGGC